MVGDGVVTLLCISSVDVSVCWVDVDTVSEVSWDVVASDFSCEVAISELLGSVSVWVELDVASLELSVASVVVVVGSELFMSSVSLELFVVSEEPGVSELSSVEVVKASELGVSDESSVIEVVSKLDAVG